MERFVDRTGEAADIVCPCSGEEDACRGRLSLSGTPSACLQDVYGEDEDVVGPYLECLADAYAAYADCLRVEYAMCGLDAPGLTNCSDVIDAEFDACPEISAPLQRRLEDCEPD